MKGSWHKWEISGAANEGRQDFRAETSSSDYYIYFCLWKEMWFEANRSEKRGSKKIRERGEFRLREGWEGANVSTTWLWASNSSVLMKFVGLDRSVRAEYLKPTNWLGKGLVSSTEVWTWKSSNILESGPKYRKVDCVLTGWQGERSKHNEIGWLPGSKTQRQTQRSQRNTKSKKALSLDYAIRNIEKCK